eukprot:3656386-Amphidinium_carterae.1
MPEALYILNDMLTEYDAAWHALKHARLIDHGAQLRGQWDPQHHKMMVDVMRIDHNCCILRDCD